MNEQEWKIDLRFSYTTLLKLKKFVENSPSPQK